MDGVVEIIGFTQPIDNDKNLYVTKISKHFNAAELQVLLEVGKAYHSPCYSFESRNQPIIAHKGQSVLFLVFKCFALLLPIICSMHSTCGVLYTVSAGCARLPQQF